MSIGNNEESIIKKKKKKILAAREKHDREIDSNLITGSYFCLPGKEFSMAGTRETTHVRTLNMVMSFNA